MTEQSGYQLLISTFDDENAGTEAVSRLLAQFKGQTQAVPAVASVVKTADGELAIRETSDLGAKQGAAAGALAGSLVGLLSRRRGVVGSAAIGALLGGVAAHKLDTGIPDPRLAAIGQALENATSAAVAIVSDEVLAEVKGIVGDLGGATVIEAIDHKTDFMKQMQSGDYAGALAALGNQTETTVSGASDSATQMVNDLLNRNKPA